MTAPLTALSALRALLAAVDAASDNAERHVIPPSSGCFDCTSGAVPDRFNTGLCAYHAARDVVFKADRETARLEVLGRARAELANLDALQSRFTGRFAIPDAELFDGGAR